MDPDRCPICVRAPCVAVAVTHPSMRALIVELLERVDHCGVVIAVSDPAGLPGALAETPVDLVIVDGADFPACCRERLSDFPLDRVVVIGAEPDAAYETAALRHGAGAWLAREDVGEDLQGALCQALGCSPRHGTPTPPEVPDS